MSDDITTMAAYAAMTSRLVSIRRSAWVMTSGNMSFTMTNSIAAPAKPNAYGSSVLTSTTAAAPSTPANSVHTTRCVRSAKGEAKSARTPLEAPRTCKWLHQAGQMAVEECLLFGHAEVPQHKGRRHALRDVLQRATGDGLNTAPPNRTTRPHRLWTALPSCPARSQQRAV